MNLPLVSICIPTYNGEKYLEECLNSAIYQTYRNIEIIIVDDHSNDNTILIVNEYLKKDNRVKLFINNTNLGLVGNWNKCIEYAYGEWIKYLFQDDLLHANCVERMVETITEECKIIACDRKFIFENGTSEKIKEQYGTKLISLQKMMKTTQPKFISFQKFIKFVLPAPNANFIGEPTAVMFRKTLFNEIGSFNPLFVQLCDLEYWLRIATNFGLLYIPETLVTFRVHGQSVTATNRNDRMDLVDITVLYSNLLKSDFYTNFRKYLSMLELKKIKELFKLRIYEMLLVLSKNPDAIVLLKQYENIKEAIPLISLYAKPSLQTKLIYSFVKMRRKFRKQI